MSTAPAHKLAHTALPLSALPGVTWPAMPTVEGARALALQYQFVQSERWPLEQLRAMQFAQIRQLLRHARGTVPFYRDRLAGLDLEGVLDESVFARIPLLARSDIQDHYDALTSRAVPAGHGRIYEGQSSGSTGRPIRFLHTELNGIFWRAFTLREHLWHRRDFSARLGSIRSRVSQTVMPGWGPATDGLFSTGSATMFNTLRPVHEQAEWLMHENPDYLICVASNLLELARYCARHGLRPSRLRGARSYGEALHPDTRAMVRQAWDVPLTDIYSCSEIGYLALQCPQHEHYHVQAEGVHIEILDEQGQPCVPGELGRVVVTPMLHFAMPLIRYDIGDYAEAGEPCDCGRGLPVIKAIRGRTRNMLRLPGGSIRHPRFGEYQFGDITAVRQFQVVQKSLSDIEVALVVVRPLTAAETDNLRAMIVKHLGHPFLVSFVYRDEIPRLPNGKYEDFRSEVTS
ncbi:MAG: hypothetical protein K2X06_08325 [Burkholderiales bacterium]|nr:hypothetical protein [Burkholderiales bacterium]